MGRKEKGGSRDVGKKIEIAVICDTTDLFRERVNESHRRRPRDRPRIAATAHANVPVSVPVLCT